VEKVAEKRMISKSISISEKVNIGLSDIFHMLLYTWMIPHSDDWGRLSGSPAKVKALICPMLDKSIKEVEIALREMHEMELIIWYEVDGHKYIQINNFEEHQSGLHKRTTSKFPEVPNDSRKFPEIPPEGKGTELKGTEGNRREEEGKGTAPTPEIKNSITNLLNQCKVQGHTLFSIDILASYTGIMEFSVIEAAIKKAQGKHVNYAINTIEGWKSEGKTTLKAILPKVQKPDKQGTSGKPKLPVYRPSTPSEPLTPEEEAEFEKLVEQLEGA
jgi:hypothetical protein